MGSESQHRQVAGSLSCRNDEPGQGSGEEELWESEDDTREVARRQVAEAQLAKQQLAKVILKLSVRLDTSQGHWQVPTSRLVGKPVGDPTRGSRSSVGTDP